MATIKIGQAIKLGSLKTVGQTRIKPFTSLPAGRPSLRAKAVAEDLDFSFSFTDARRANEYSPADVEAAMRFYTDGEGTASPFDTDFVTNTLGTEDASFFDDIDHEEAYGDEYIVAGIPEAAPKKRGMGRKNQGGGNDEDDDLEMAKALDKVKALEDRMVLEAALEENFADAGQQEAAEASDARKADMWDWLTDPDSTVEMTGDSQELEPTRKSTKAGSLTDGQVTSDIALSKPELFEDTEVPAYMELFSNDDVTEDVLAAIGSADADYAGEDFVSSITDEDLARLDAILAEEAPVLTLDKVEGAPVPRLDDMPELNKDLVTNYIQQLRATMGSGGASMAEVKALFGAEEPLTVEALEGAASEAAVKEFDALVAAPEPTATPLSGDLDAHVSAVVDETGEPAEDDDGGFERELRSLAAIEPFSEADLLDEVALDGLEGYLVAAEDFVAQEEARKAGIAEAVARGELSPDALAEELEDVEDAEDELVRNLAMEDDEDAADMSMVEESDGETWTERIIELTRVTKVVKGGKIMGFRCVAIVGNQAGLVGVGCQAGREVAVAVKRTLVDAKRNVVRVSLVGAGTVPHRSEAKYHAARCVVVPASDGTGCIAGGSVRSVLELAGVKNVLAKRLGSRSALNSARATVRALQQMQSLYDVSKARGVPMERLLLPQN